MKFLQHSLRRVCDQYHHCYSNARCVLFPSRLIWNPHSLASQGLCPTRPYVSSIGSQNTAAVDNRKPSLFSLSYSTSFPSSCRSCLKINQSSLINNINSTPLIVRSFETYHGLQNNDAIDLKSSRWQNFKNKHKKILLLIGFFSGVFLGGSIKVAYNSGIFTLPYDEDDQSWMLCDSQFINTFIPLVNASKGFSFLKGDDDDDAQNSDSNNNNLFSGSGGKGPLGHRANFNFIADVVERLAPSVVYIEIKDLRRRDRDGAPLGINNGSGFVVSEDGLILTNAHVVTNRPRASKVWVRLNDGREMEGRLEEVDPASDLALVRIDAKGLVAAPLGVSSTLRPGEFVVAVGSPLSLSNSVTAGVVSSTSRKAKELGIRANDIQYIQTDAAITFGNSGGPLADLDGSVIGINSMKAASGISFAIPIDTAKIFLKKAISKREEKHSSSQSSSDSAPKRRRYLGITMLSLTQDIITELQSRAVAPLPNDISHGVLVWRVVVGSPAYHAGLQPGDVVTEINGHACHSAGDVYRILERQIDLTMVVHRGNNRYSVTVTPEE